MRLLSITVSFVAAMLTVTAQQSYAAGGDILFKKNCASCHYTDGPAKEKTITDQLAKKGPELWYAGSKFQKPWLVAWLQKPIPIRPMKYNSLTEKNTGDHPKLSADDAEKVTNFLMALTSDEVKKGMLKAKASLMGRRLFIKDMQCSGCHSFTMRGQVHGGKSGPSLIGASMRLNPDWIYAYMANIKVFKPVRDMPDYSGVFNTKKLQDVAAYVATFE